MADTRNETMNSLFDRGLALRRQVLGPEYVDGSLKAANEFMMAFQHITTGNGAGAMRGGVLASILRHAVCLISRC